MAVEEHQFGKGLIDSGRGSPPSRGVADDTQSHSSSWHRLVDKGTGSEYYYDEATGKSQWEKPVEVPSSKIAANPQVSLLLLYSCHILLIKYFSNLSVSFYPYIYLYIYDIIVHDQH